MPYHWAILPTQHFCKKWKFISVKYLLTIAVFHFFTMFTVISNFLICFVYSFTYVRNICFVFFNTFKAFWKRICLFYLSRNHKFKINKHIRKTKVYGNLPKRRKIRKWKGNKIWERWASILKIKRIKARSIVLDPEAKEDIRLKKNKQPCPTSFIMEG